MKCLVLVESLGHKSNKGCLVLVEDPFDLPKFQEQFKFSLLEYTGIK